MSEDFPIFTVTRNRDRLKVTLCAATEMIFEIRIENDDAVVFADVCHIAPAMVSYDVDLAEAYDDAFRTRPKPSEVLKVSAFAQKYNGRLHNISAAFDEFPDPE